VSNEGGCIARVWDISNFVILTNVGARRAWGNAPSVEVLSRVLSVGMCGYSLVKTKLKGTFGWERWMGYKMFTPDG
jgi:hypothetical protein